MAVELKALGEQLQEQLRGIVALQPPQPPQPPPEYPRDERLEWLERAITEDEPEVLQRHALIRALRACGERELLGWCADSMRRASQFRVGWGRDEGADAIQLQALALSWQNRYRDEAARAHELASRVYALDGELEAAREELARLKSERNRRSVQHAEELGRASKDGAALKAARADADRYRKERDLWYHAHGEAEAQRAAVERRFAQLGDLVATTGGDAVPRAHTLRANADLNALLRQAALEHEHRAGAASP